MARTLILDLETENHAYFGAVASPRHPENYVVAVGVAVEEQPFTGQIEHLYFTSKAQAEEVGFLHIPDDVNLIVAHNAPFEIMWFLVKHRATFLKFLDRGGRVFCTAYAEYLLSNQQELYPALDTTAPKYGGTHKVDGIKVLWEQGVLTSQIDPKLLLEYLVGPNGDIENTRKVFYGQVALLQSRGMWDMALCRMEGMLFNCFAMDSGLYVDRDIAFKQLAEQNAQLDALLAEFKQYRTHIPDYVGFKDSSDYHMSAWLFGGPIKYRVKDTWFNDDGTPKYEKDDFYKFGETLVPVGDVSTAQDFEVYVILHGPAVRSTAGKNKGMPRVFREEVSTPKQKYYDRVFDCAPLVQLSLLPKEIEKSFREEFQGKRKLADETPVYGTGKDSIEMLSKRQELPENVRAVLASLLKYAKLDKDVSTYYLRDKLDEEGNVVKQSGMLQYLTPESIVYHMLNCTATVTTRLSSNRPNFQNIPRADTSDVKEVFTSNVKKVFTSRFDSPVWLAHAVRVGLITQALYGECMAAIGQAVPVGAILEADYSALEVVTLAAFSKDTNLVKALLEGIDMHCMRLSQQLGEPYEDVLKKCKDATHPEHKKYKTMRTDIKPKAFAYQYGATAAGIAFATGCSVEEAQDFIDAEKALFPEVEAYYENVITKAVESNVRQHREQRDDGSWGMYKTGVWQSPGGTCYEFRQHPKTRWVDGQRIDLMEFKPTQLRNYPIQGESGFFVQGIAGAVVRWLVSRNFFDGKVFIINQVHDALYLDVHRSVLHEVALTVKHIMQSLPEFFKPYGYDLGVPFPAEVEAGPSMYHKEKVA